MPSFLLLGEHETKVVIEYVRWLAIRGEFEKRLVADLASDYSEGLDRGCDVKRPKAAYAEKEEE